MTTQPTNFTKGLVGLVLGTTALLGSAAPALAASNYKVIHKETVLGLGSSPAGGFDPLLCTQGF